MLSAKRVDFFAHQSGIRDRAVAEREVVLAYALQLLVESGLHGKLAFKGGTCIRKIHLGASGRFSMDLDFTAVEEMTPETAILDLMAVLNQEYHGIQFTLDDQWRVTHGGLSFAVVPTYRHAWNDAGAFDLQVSLREQPVLPVRPHRLMEQPYFRDLEFVPSPLPSLDLHEVLAEKVRALYQRTKARDLYDLFLFTDRPFQRGLVRRLAVLKLWQVRDPFDPDRFFGQIGESAYEWEDLTRLVRGGDKPVPRMVVQECLRAYAFLRGLTAEEAALAGDARAHRETGLQRALADGAVEMWQQLMQGGSP